MLLCYSFLAGTLLGDRVIRSVQLRESLEKTLNQNQKKKNGIGNGSHQVGCLDDTNFVVALVVGPGLAKHC